MSLSPFFDMTGCTAAEKMMIIQTQQLLKQRGGNAGNQGPGTQTSSDSSSPPSPVNSRLLLDPASLLQLSPKLDALVEQISLHLKQLEDQMQRSLANTQNRAGNVISDADAEINRTREILASIDDLDIELAEIRNISNIVKGFRGRIEYLDHRINQSSSRRR